MVVVLQPADSTTPRSNACLSLRNFIRCVRYPAAGCSLVLSACRVGPTTSFI